MTSHLDDNIEEVAGTEQPAASRYPNIGDIQRQREEERELKLDIASGRLVIYPAINARVSREAGSTLDLLDKFSDIDKAINQLYQSVEARLDTVRDDLWAYQTDEQQVIGEISLSLAIWTAAFSQSLLSGVRSLELMKLARENLIGCLVNATANQQGVSDKVAESLHHYAHGIRQGDSEVGEDLRLAVQPFLRDQGQDYRTFAEDRERLTSSLQELYHDELYAVARIVLEVASEEVE
jgi:hypothetical protein